MAQPYVGEVRMFGGNFAPAGWMFCEGQLLPISENETLFQLIGTTYGGDGESTFALPDLRGRIPIHQGNGFLLAETGGVEDVTLTFNQIPTHSHPFLGSTNTATSPQPANNVPGKSTQIDLFINAIPVFGTLLSVVLINETFHLFHLAALLLVLGGIAIAEWGRPKT